MATIREYFDADLSQFMAIHKPWGFTSSDGSILPEVAARISQDDVSNAKFWSFFIPSSDSIMDCVHTLFYSDEVNRCVLGPEGDGLVVLSGFSNYSEQASSETLIFTKRIFLFIDADLSESDRASISRLGATKGFHVLVRDREYARVRSALEKPLAFISHDSSDKDTLVRELALELSKLMCPVWYDEYSLKVGKSLRESIESGLKETKNCVLILSESFLSNEGWGKAEFDSIYTREIVEGKNVILPIWHGVTRDQVFDYSPRLADKIALDSNIGVKELAKKLAREIKANGN